MKKLLFGAVAALALTATPAFAQSCNDEDLQLQMKKMFAESHNLDGLRIIDFEDERETSELPPNAMGVTVLSCKANVLLSNSTYNHLIYNREVHDNGKFFIGYVMRYGKYPVAPVRVAPPPPVPVVPRYTLGAPDEMVPSAIPSPATSPMFQKGFTDRASWEIWVAGLSSDYRTGAEYWAGQRSLSHPGSCNGVPAFMAGCREAQSRLAPADVLRKSEPDYKAGWNSYGH
jgi:hypothetical protein